MPDFSRLPGLLQHLQGFENNVSLTLLVPHLADGSSVRITDCRGSWNSDRPVKLVRRREHDRRESGLFQHSGSQSAGLAAKRSGRCEQDRIDLLLFHVLRYRYDALFQEVGALPLEPVV
jgi:hypothetical protein